MATRRQVAAARRNIRSAQAANRRRGAGRGRSSAARAGSARRTRARGNPRNRAPGTRGMSTREYGRATTASSRNATYTYPRGAGADRGRRPSYPIDTMAHARNALARAASPRNAGSVAQVKRALRAKGGQFRALANRSTAGGGGRRRR